MSISAETAKIVAIYVDGTSAAAPEGWSKRRGGGGHDPFYAESGGQVGDEGVITSGSARFAVGDTLKIKADVFGHHGTLEEGTLNVGDTVQAQVNTACAPPPCATTRSRTSCTRPCAKCWAAMQQKGSLGMPTAPALTLRTTPVTDAEIREIERRVNEEIGQHRHRCACDGH